MRVLTAVAAFLAVATVVTFFGVRAFQVGITGFFYSPLGLVVTLSFVFGTVGLMKLRKKYGGEDDV